MKRGLAGSMSNSSFLTSSSGSICSSKSPSRLSVAQEEDSLSVLLRERAAARREKECRATNLDAEDKSGTAILQHGLPMGTLEEAWIEFAALTAIARERVARTRALHGGVVDPDESGAQTCEADAGPYTAEKSSSDQRGRAVVS
ncbi:hypothetical protein GQ600_10908 [Phytophthora cactorum]|nr:hypothetical protein GQ600_10908 [Phytophthora cactorum]